MHMRVIVIGVQILPIKRLRVISQYSEVPTCCVLQGYAPLYDPFETFFSRYVYRRVQHCFNRPITSAPGAELTLKERCTDDRNWTFRYSLLY